MMNGRIKEDLMEMKKKLKEYVDQGYEAGPHETRKEPVIAVKPDKFKIKPLRKMQNCDVHFLAVDCSTRTLKRANNWGVYLLRTAYASVRARNVDWGYEERLCSVVGDVRTRYRFLEDARVELESMMALGLLREGVEWAICCWMELAILGVRENSAHFCMKNAKERGLAYSRLANNLPCFMMTRGGTSWRRHIVYARTVCGFITLLQRRTYANIYTEMYLSLSYVKIVLESFVVTLCGTSFAKEVRWMSYFLR